MQWIINNKEWVFSGIGVFAISFISALFIKNKGATKQIQKAGKDSINYQAAGDINIGVKNDKG